MSSLSRVLTRPVMLALSVAFAIAITHPLSAQVTEADLVRENERLVAEVQDLQAALEAALTRIRELESTLAAVKSGNLPSSGGAKSAVVTAPPEASQEGLLATIRNAFAAAVEAEEIAPAPTGQDDAARIRHMRSLQRWVAASNRSFKTQIEWPVVVMESEVTSTSEGRLRLQVWDPANAVTVGNPFDVTVARRVVDRVNRPRPGDAQTPAVFNLEGVFTPAIRVNENRLEIGPFDNPRFVGPLVEMSWTVDVKGIGPWVEPEATAVVEDAD